MGQEGTGRDGMGGEGYGREGQDDTVRDGTRWDNAGGIGREGTGLKFQFKFIQV